MKKFILLFLSALLLLSVAPMTVGAATTESWDAFAYYQDGPEFSFKATEFVGEQDKYQFVVAAYNSKDNLVAVKCADATVDIDGTLTAAVNFEENGTEADVSIEYVKTMLWDSFDSLQPLVRNGYFDIEAQTVDEDGVYNNLTNGFYEPVTNYDKKECYWWGKSTDTASHPDGLVLINGADTPLTTDHNPSTFERPTFAAQSSLMGYYSNKLKAASVIDRVVVYYGYTGTAVNDVQFYLSNIPINYTIKLEDGKSYAYPTNFKKQDTADVEYLGYRGDSTSYVSFKDMNGTGRIVFNADGNEFSNIVAAYDFNTIGGYIKEMQAYKKVQDEDVVSKAQIKAKWDTLSYDQNGPAFAVNATNFSTNATEPYFVATAYKTDGTSIVKEAAITAPAATLSVGVDFEEGGIEADVNIDYVETKVIDKASDTVLVEAKEFEVEEQTVSAEGVYNNLTNGFYETITDYSGQEYMHWNKTDDLEAHPDGIYNASGQNTKGTTDYKVATDYEKPTFAANSSYMGFYSNKLRTATVIDRVVVYYGYTSNAANDVRFYLANV
ncbi:MAG: hypothetical protein II997_05070, partial [Clostridia bacterium]|nr:hypothetical protein [Clostridia bacterium]